MTTYTLWIFGESSTFQTADAAHDAADAASIQRGAPVNGEHIQVLVDGVKVWRDED